MSALATAALAGAAWTGAATFLAAGASAAPPSDGHLRVTTSDGWVLRVRVHLPPPGVPVRPIPVVLGHGLVMGSRCWSLTEATSVPRLLAAAGHRVFVAEYRGSRGSTPPKHCPPWRFDVDDFADQDVPAIIDAACAVAGSTTCSWVGHSMGGMVAYLYAARRGSGRLHRVVTLGSPARLGASPAQRALLPLLGPLLARDRKIRLHALALLGLPGAVAIPGLVAGQVFAADKWGLQERTALLTDALHDTSSGVLRWFVDRKLKRQAVVDDSIGGWAGLTAPLLVVASRKDRVVPFRTSRLAFEQAAARQRCWRLLPDFGHNDLICSQESTARVLPLVRTWLEGDDADLAALPST